MLEARFTKIGEDHSFCSVSNGLVDYPSFTTFAMGEIFV